MIKALRKEFRRVEMELKSLTYGRIPMWAIVIWFVVLLPVGLVLYPFVKLYYLIKIRQLDKFLKEFEA